MKPKTDYTEVFIIGSTAYSIRHPKHSGSTRCAAIDMTGIFPSKPGNILFYPGIKPVSGLNKKILIAAFRRMANSPFWRKIYLGFWSLLRKSKRFDDRQNSNSSPERVHPLKNNAEPVQAQAGFENKTSPKTGRPDAQVILDMKRNRVTMAYEFYRIMDNPNY